MDYMSGEPINTKKLLYKDVKWCYNDGVMDG